MPGLMELLAALERAGIPKGLLTRAASGCWSRPCWRTSRCARFQFVLTAEDIRRGKPNPEIYRNAAARFGLPPRQVLVLEDSQNGCLAAAAAGTYAVAVPGEHSRAQDFAAATLRIESLRDSRLYELLGLPAR